MIRSQNKVKHRQVTNIINHKTEEVRLNDLGHSQDTQVIVGYIIGSKISEVSQSKRFKMQRRENYMTNLKDAEYVSTECVNSKIVHCSYQRLNLGRIIRPRVRTVRKLTGGNCESR